jgi:hypothetical protein
MQIDLKLLKQTGNVPLVTSVCYRDNIHLIQWRHTCFFDVERATDNACVLELNGHNVELVCI